MLKNENIIATQHLQGRARGGDNLTDFCKGHMAKGGGKGFRRWEDGCVVGRDYKMLLYKIILPTSSSMSVTACKTRRYVVICPLTTPHSCQAVFASTESVSTSTSGFLENRPSLLILAAPPMFRRPASTYRYVLSMHGGYGIGMCE